MSKIDFKVKTTSKF